MVMLMLIMSIAVVCYTLVDLVEIYRDKQWAIFCFYSLAMVFVLVISLCISMNIKLPSPAIPVKNLINAVFGL